MNARAYQITPAMMALAGIACRTSEGRDHLATVRLDPETNNAVATNGHMLAEIDGTRLRLSRARNTGDPNREPLLLPVAVAKAFKSAMRREPAVLEHQQQPGTTDTVELATIRNGTQSHRIETKHETYPDVQAVQSPHRKAGQPVETNAPHTITLDVSLLWELARVCKTAAGPDGTHLTLTFQPDPDTGTIDPYASVGVACEHFTEFAALIMPIAPTKVRKKATRAA